MSLEPIEEDFEEPSEVHPLAGSLADNEGFEPTGEVIDLRKKQNVSKKIFERNETDQFLRDFYYYFRQQGFWCIVVKELFRIILLIFIIITNFLILNHVNLYGLLLCKGEECLKVPIWINSGIFGDYSIFNYLVIVLCLIIFGYLLYTIFDVLKVILRVRKIREFVHLSLKLSDSELTTITWDEFCNFLVEYDKEHKILSKDREFDALDICNRIMLIDNLLIALENTGILRLNIPLLNHRVFPTFLNMNLRAVLERFVSNNESFKNYESKELIRSFRILGIINFVLSPFIFVFVLLRTLFGYFGSFQVNKGFMFATRRWSSLTLLRFQCYNELPHEFQRRIGKANEFAQFYVDQFPNPISNIIGKLIMFYSSTLAAIFIIMVTVRNPVLIHVTFFGQSILWWSVVVLGVFTFGSSLVASDNACPRPAKFFRRLARYTLYVPDQWRGKEETWKVYREFINNYYQTSIHWFLVELGSIFFTPYLLCFVLPSATPAIAKFFEDGTDEFTSCGFASFDFNKYQNFSIKVNETFHDSNLKRLVTREITYRPSESDRKMEASYLIFRKNHPSWVQKYDLGSEVFLKSLIRVNEDRLGKEFANKYLRQCGFTNAPHLQPPKPVREEKIIILDSEEEKEESFELDEMKIPEVLKKESHSMGKEKSPKTVMDNLTKSNVMDVFIGSLILENKVDFGSSMIKLKRELSSLNRKVPIDRNVYPSFVILGQSDSEDSGEEDSREYDDEEMMKSPDDWKRDDEISTSVFLEDSKAIIEEVTAENPLNKKMKKEEKQNTEEDEKLDFGDFDDVKTPMRETPVTRKKNEGFGEDGKRKD